MADHSDDDEHGGGGGGGGGGGSANLLAMQAELLKQKADVMRSLGLDELGSRFDSALTDAAKAARKRKSTAAAAAAAAASEPGMLRRSSRYVQRGAVHVGDIHMHTHWDYPQPSTTTTVQGAGSWARRRASTSCRGPH